MPFCRAYGRVFPPRAESLRTLFHPRRKLHGCRQAIALENVTVCGDTRSTVCGSRGKTHTAVPIIEKFKGLDLLWVCGSTSAR